MRHNSETQESSEALDRCKLINNCLSGNNSKENTTPFFGKRSYVGVLYRINNVIQKSEKITRKELVEKIDICWVDIRDSVNRLIADGTIVEDYKKNSHHIFRASK